MSDFRERLEKYLLKRGSKHSIERLTPDASTREYFRIGWHIGTAIACVYPEPFVEKEQSYLDVTQLFSAARLPVAEVLDFDEDLGVIILEDLGDHIFRDELNNASGEFREGLICKAIDLIPRIQAATSLAFQADSIASRLKFDNEKLLWELNFFKEHYFTTLKKQPLDKQVDAKLSLEFDELCRELESKAAVLCHRDYHAANLMLDRAGELRIIDHQDARIGSVAYDLVSFLLDRIVEPPSAEWLAEKRRHFLAERVRIGLEPIDEFDFAEEFRLQTIQRCLKAVGTFSYQSAVRDKKHFVPFILPMFRIVVRAAGNVNAFPTLIKILRSEIDEKSYKPSCTS